MSHDTPKSEFSRREPLNEEQQAPAIRAQLTITLYEGGNCNVDGPFHDRILYAGLLYIAAEIERDMFAQSRTRALAQEASAGKKPSVVQRFMQAGRERAAKNAAERAAAEKRGRDELSKALEQNSEPRTIIK